MNILKQKEVKYLIEILIKKPKSESKDNTSFNVISLANNNIKIIILLLRTLITSGN